MSPLALRRYRAERLLRAEFELLRGRVITAVRGRLGASAARLDPSDLDACYAQAWQGLYAAILEGREIANPTGWLVVVTFRRAVEELRAQPLVDHGAGRAPRAGMAGERVRSPAEGPGEPDFAADLDDRIRLRQLFEGLRARLSSREREAAALCYLQGLSRSQAAARMGISQSRMRKLMDGQGAARPGVAHKVGALAETIRAGGWCEQQGSLMRGLAYGMLDPDGERYRLALLHQADCPACRAYVLSLRGLAAALPPALLPWALGAEALTHAGVSGHPGAAAASASAHSPAQLATATATGGGAGGGQAAGIGAMSLSGAAGAGGAAGGSWLWAGGSLGAKVAVGCLLALGVGAGCVAFTAGPHPARAPVHQGAARAISEDWSRQPYGVSAGRLEEARPAQRDVGQAGAGTGSSSPNALTGAERVAREFGPERASSPVKPSSGSPAPIATSASSAAPPPASPQSPRAGPAAGAPGATTAASSSAGRSVPESAGAGAPAAEREFGIE